MAAYLDKINMPIAVSDHTKLDLGHQHITTSDFMELGVDYIRECVPGEKISVNMETFVRMNAMPVPTFSRSNLKHSAFFVPMRTIQRSFNDMMVDTVHIGSNGDISDNGLVSQTPVITMKNLRDIFMGSVASEVGDSGSTTTMLYKPGYIPGSDFVADIAIESGGDTIFYNFTSMGRQVYKTLCSLGYQISFDSEYSDTFSLLPILALIKVYADYYFVNQYQNLSIYQNMLLLTNYDNGSDVLGVDVSVLRSILVLCSYVQFESDIYTSAWDNPAAPSQGNFSTLTFRDLTINGAGPNTGNEGYGTEDGNWWAPFYTNNSFNSNFGVGNVASNGTPVSIMDSHSTAGTVVRRLGMTVSDYQHKALTALSDYMKRHQLSSRSWERFLSRYGQSLPAEKLNRSVYLGTQIQPIQIGDVFSSSDTEGAKLGDFAGRGQSYGQAQWDYSTDEFGYFIVLTSVVPSTGYFQGVDPQVYRITKSDHYVPEFDALGVEAIKGSQIYVPVGTMSGMTGAPSQVFGFYPRYASYKASLDKISGNMRINSLGGASALFPDTVNGNNAWHTMRVFDGLQTFSGSSANIVHSPDFIYGYKNAGQFKRLFYDVDPASPDNMTLIHNFEISSWFPGKGLYDTYEFDNEDDNPRRVRVQNNGVKVN